MIDLDEIRDEIAVLEHGSTSYSACEKLHILYDVLEHFGRVEPSKEQRSIPDYSTSEEPLSEFRKAVLNAPFDGVMNVLDEHMEAVKAIFPKEYDEVLRQIEKLK